MSSNKFDKYLKDFEKPTVPVEHNPEFEKVAPPPPKVNDTPNSEPQKLNEDIKESIESIESKEDAKPKDSLSKYEISKEVEQEKDAPDHEIEL